VYGIHSHKGTLVIKGTLVTCVPSSIMARLFQDVMCGHTRKLVTSVTSVNMDLTTCLLWL